MQKTEPLTRRIRGLIERREFSERDVRALKIAAAVLVLFLVFSIYRAVFPAGSAIRSEVGLMRGQLNEIRALKEEYRYSRDILAKVSGSMKEEKEALISVAEKSASQKRRRPPLLFNKGNQPVGEGQGNKAGEGRSGQHKQGADPEG